VFGKCYTNRKLINILVVRAFKEQVRRETVVLYADRRHCGNIQFSINDRICVSTGGITKSITFPLSTSSRALSPASITTKFKAALCIECSRAQEVSHVVV
jgi:hypothetical protein